MVKSVTDILGVPTAVWEGNPDPEDISTREYTVDGITYVEVIFNVNTNPSKPYIYLKADN